MTPVPAIVIPFRNRHRYLELLLEALPPYLERENGIREFTIYVAEQASPDLFNLALSRNVGAAFALAEGRCDYLVFHNVDVIPVSGVDYHMPGHEVTWFLDAGSCKVHRETFARVNGYNPAYAGWGSEDTDFCCRLTTLGYDARLWHRTDEARNAVVCNLELPELPEAEALAWSRRYFGISGPDGPRFVPFRGAPPLQRYDKRDFFFEEERRRNEAVCAAFHALPPAARAAQMLRLGVHSVRLSEVRVAERRPRVVWLAYETGAVNP